MVFRRKQNIETITGTGKDAGLKKAVTSTKCRKLPSNFSYMTMKKINDAVLRKEKTREKRLFISMIITCLLMIGTCAAIVWVYMGDRISARFNNIKFAIENASISETAVSNFLFYLPTIVSLILIYLFNKWMRKKFGHLLDE